MTSMEALTNTVGVYLVVGILVVGFISWRSPSVRAESDITTIILGTLLGALIWPWFLGKDNEK